MGEVELPSHRHSYGALHNSGPTLAPHRDVPSAISDQGPLSRPELRPCGGYKGSRRRLLAPRTSADTLGFDDVVAALVRLRVVVRSAPADAAEWVGLECRLTCTSGRADAERACIGS